MRLYYFADGCSLATHIALREAGIVPELTRVDVATRLTDDGRPFGAVNPKGYVPALVLDDGTTLTENVALLDWVAQRSDALRPAGEQARTLQMETLAFISTEIHRPFLFLLFFAGEEIRPAIQGIIAGRFAHAAQRMAGDWLLGERFSTADAFLYVMLRWASTSDLALPPALEAYRDRIAARPAVRAALAAEGLAA